MEGLIVPFYVPSLERLERILAHNGIWIKRVAVINAEPSLYKKNDVEYRAFNATLFQAYGKKLVLEKERNVYRLRLRCGCVVEFIPDERYFGHPYFVELCSEHKDEEVQ